MHIVSKDAYVDGDWAGVELANIKRSFETYSLSLPVERAYCAVHPY